FKAGADDVGVMDEQIFAARLRLDEAEAFFVVEPLYDTSFCLHFLQSLKNMSGMPYRRLSRCRDLSKKVLYWYWIVLTSTNLKIWVVYYREAIFESTAIFSKIAEIVEIWYQFINTACKHFPAASITGIPFWSRATYWASFWSIASRVWS